jgi:DNA-binding NtrC family response regulator
MGGPPRGNGERGSVSRMSRGHILVLDDEPGILTTLHKALTLEGHIVDVAGGIRVAEERG